MTAALIPRVGTGFDVHVLEAGRPLMLCGVAVPHDKGLAGHSDADVGIHALCDAIYGALAEGDIGRHFPPTEAAWKNADSARFLAHAAARIAAARRQAGQCRRDPDLRAAEDRPACGGDARAAGRAPGGRSVPHLGEGHHDRKARLHRAWRGHRRAGRRHRAVARLRRFRLMRYCAIAVSAAAGRLRRFRTSGPNAGTDGRDDPQAAGQPGSADLATGTLGLDGQLVCLGARPIRRCGQQQWDLDAALLGEDRFRLGMARGALVVAWRVALAAPPLRC